MLCAEWAEAFPRLENQLIRRNIQQVHVCVYICIWVTIYTHTEPWIWSVYSINFQEVHNEIKPAWSSITSHKWFARCYTIWNSFPWVLLPVLVRTLIVASNPIFFWMSFLRSLKNWGLSASSCKHKAEGSEVQKAAAQQWPKMLSHHPHPPQQICSQLLSPLKGFQMWIVVLRIRYMQVSTIHHQAWTLTG